MQKPVFRRKALLVAMAAAQLMLAQQALAAESNVVSVNQTNSVEILEEHSTFDIMQGVTINVVAPENGSVYVGSPVGDFTNAGQITASADQNIAPLIGLNVASHINKLVNTHYISADALHGSIGLVNNGAIGMLLNGGTITGDTGIENRGHLDIMLNSGEIYGSRIAFNNAGGELAPSLQEINNSGTIGSNTGIAIKNDAPILRIINQGTIAGHMAAIDSPGSIQVIDNNGRIYGDIYYLSTSAMTLNGDTRGIGYEGVFSSFGGPPATIYSPRADLLLGYGRIGMNNNINVGDDHSVINQSASMRVWQPITITGNYQQKENATLEIGVDGNPIAEGFTSDTGYGRLIVSGTANVAAGSNILLSRNGSPYPFAAGQRYLVIVANENGTEYNTDNLRYGVEEFNGTATGKTVIDSTTGTRGLAIILGDSVPSLPPETTPTNPNTPPDTATPTPPPETLPPETTTPSTPEPDVIKHPTPQPETTAPATPELPQVVIIPSNPVPPVVTTPRPGQGFATTQNAASALKGLSTYSGYSDGLLNLYNASMAIGSREEANKAGEQLSPVQNSAASSTASAASLDALTVVSNHVDSVRLARTSSVQRGIATGDDPLEWAFWGQPFYGNVRQGMVDNVSGYSAHYGGLVLGADRQVAENWRAGGALSYSHSSVRGSDNLTGNHTDVDAWGGIAYASWTGSPWYVNLSASVTRQQYESQRAIAFDGFSGQANGKFNGVQMVTKGEVGYPILFGEGTTLTPLAAMSYSYLHQDAYKEQSDSGAALDVDSSHSQSVRHSLGAKLEHSWETPAGDLVPFVQAMWTHEYDRSRTANSASYVADSLGETRFTSFGATPTADTADLSAGVTLVQGDDLSLSARYDLSTAPHFDAQTVSLRLRKMF